MPFFSKLNVYFHFMRPYEIGKYDEGYAFMNSLKEDSKKDHKGMETVKKH